MRVCVGGGVGGGGGGSDTVLEGEYGLADAMAVNNRLKLDVRRRDDEIAKVNRKLGESNDQCAASPRPRSPLPLPPTHLPAVRTSDAAARRIDVLNHIAVSLQARARAWRYTFPYVAEYHIRMLRRRSCRTTRGSLSSRCARR